MIPKVEVNATVTDGPLVSKRVEASAKRDGFRAMGRFHNLRIMHRHTDSGASTKYGYAPRSRNYVKQAKKINAQWRPLFLRGVLARSLKEQVEPRATQFGGRFRPVVQFSGNNFRAGLTGRLRFKKGQTELTLPQEQLLLRVAELTQLPDSERAELVDAWNAGYAKGIDTRRRVRVTKARS